MKKTLFFKNINTINNYLLYRILLSMLIGFLLFYLICGLRILNPSNIAWLSNGDAAQHYLGWLFYRSSSWSFPIGLNLNWGMENGVSIAYADSIPIFAVFFKLFNPILPEIFQYFGIWILLCFILQAFFIIRLLSAYEVNITIIVCACIIGISAPPMLFRIGQQALVGHWLIIWALGLYLFKDKNINYIEWGGTMYFHRSTCLFNFYLRMYFYRVFVFAKKFISK